MKNGVFWDVMPCGSRTFTRATGHNIPVDAILDSCNLFIINRLSNILNLNERRMLYYGLICPLLLHRIVVWAHSAKALTRRISFVKKRAVTYSAGLKHPESCRNSFINLNILPVYSLYIQETILYVKGKCDCTVNEQIHTYNTRNIKDYHK
jgi:hypothetical protein